MAQNTYTEESIRSLDWREHIRLRPGMYIGKLGDGTAPDDGIYVLVKEILDNSIDEHTMGFGKTIEIRISDHRVEVRDFGRGIPLGSVIDCVSKINTGGKYDSGAFQKSVGLNGVGTKAVNALSAYFKVRAVREGQAKEAEFRQGELVTDQPVLPTKEKNGTLIAFEPDGSIFPNYRFNPAFLEEQIWIYAFLNAGLTLRYNGKDYHSEFGLKDLLARKADLDTMCYPIIHLKGKDIEVAITHTNGQYSETFFSFVNGQNTTMGGTHLNAFKDALRDTLRKFFKKDYEPSDIRSCISASISVRVQDPIFESQTKTKLGSAKMAPDGDTINSYVGNFLAVELDNYLHRNPSVAEALKKRIEQSEKERKEIAGIKKLANERAKKANLHNRKLRDCRLHFNDKKEGEKKYASTLFITEGDSASGSITKARDVETQAVFSLKGKPLNCFGLTKKIVYENEEFNLLQHALDIEESLDDLRYNRIVIATDADVDGMHIRLLMLTFFLQFFPDLVRRGHVYILDTPLFRVRNKQKTFYCYSEEEKQKAIRTLGGKPEITRFKGLGEISPDEFGRFIGKDIRLEPVILRPDTPIKKLLNYYMGKNTQERQQFIIENLRIEKDEPLAVE